MNRSGSLLLLLLACVSLLLLGACGGGASQQRAAEKLPPAPKIDPNDTGTIAGKVTLSGAPPAMPVIDFSSNPQCERQHSAPVRAQTVLLNGNGTLQNVFVYISAGLPRVQWSAPAKSAVLDQKGCIYTPHVLGLMQGQQLEIINSDPVNHNVHAEAKVNQAWNESEPPRAEHKLKTFDVAEVLIPVSCSVHPWMRAYLGVSPNPFFAVTGTDGTFSLPDVPPGTYTVDAVHEKYGRKQGKAVVNKGGTATVDFTYGNAE